MSTQISISPVIKLEVNTTPITGGSAGRILFQTTSNTVGESSNLFWDATNNRLGIGTSTPAQTLDIVGSLNSTSSLNGDLDNLIIRNTLNGAASQTRLRFYNELTPSTTTGGAIFYTSNAYSGFPSNSFGFWNYNTNGVIALATNNTERFRIFATGNVSINTTTDAGFRLDVNGTARVQNTTTITKGASNYITFEPSANGTSPFLDMFFSGQVSTRISLGTTSSTRVFLFRDLGTALGMGIDCGAIFSNSNAILIGGAEQKVQIAGTTNNYLQFTQAGTSNRGTIGYAAGQSYMQIRVNGATDLATGTFSTAFFSSGNVGINTTTDAGFRLDVNGTARVTGAMTIGNSVITGNFGNLTLSNNGIAGVVLTFSNNRWGTSDLAVFGTQGAHADASSQIEIRSTTRGFLPPRMTTAQKNAIATPATGLMVYDTDLNRPCFYNGSSWITL